MTAIGEIERLVIHHSASPITTTFEEILAWHTKPKPEGNGWPAVGYHKVILYDGTVRIGRPIHVRGAHAPPNRGRIGVCLVGDNTKPGQGWTFEQIDALKREVEAWRVVVPGILVCGHRDIMRPGYTECPGLDVRDLVGG